MRPLPRLLAFADDRIGAREDLGIRAAAIAALGAPVALVARLPGGTADALAHLAGRFVALARPPMAAVLVTGRTDIAIAAGAQGVILRDGDLPVADARRVRDATGATSSPGFWYLRTVHSEQEADAAAAEGADALIAGAIWETPTHADRRPAGTALLARIAGRGIPTYAIGGVTAARAAEARDAGAWGVAAIRAVWDADDSFRAAGDLVAPWQEEQS